MNDLLNRLKSMFSDVAGVEAPRDEAPPPQAAQQAPAYVSEGPLASGMFKEAQGPGFPEAAVSDTRPVEIAPHIQRALELVKKYENPALKEDMMAFPYGDGPKKAIGFGLQIHPLTGKPVTASDAPIDYVTAEEGARKWLEDLDKRLVGPGFDKMNSDQRSAALSAMFNMGAGPIVNNRALQDALERGDRRAANDAFTKTMKSRIRGRNEKGGLEVMGGLIERRAEEASTFRGWTPLEETLMKGLMKPTKPDSIRPKRSTSVFGRRG